MSTPITNTTQSTNRAGLCPHGLPPAACPICSGGAMGGANKLKDTAVSKPTNSNQWSWMKCYAAGLALRAQENRVENAKSAFDKQIEFAKQLKISIQNLSDRIKTVIESIQKNLPTSFSNIIQSISNIIIFPLLNLIAKLPQLIEKFAQFQQNIANFLLQASEKLTALLGDLKNFINKKITDKLKEKAKKFFLFFMSNIEDENYQNDDTLAVFKSRELKKFIAKIIKTSKKRNKNAN